MKLPIDKILLKKRPIVIAGPCSAETEEQMVTTARELASTNKVDILRAGIWKPRTRPGKFEGVGEIGLSWLQTAKEQTGLSTMTEVASTQQAQLALKYNIDAVWIGARTVSNPFAVQEVADSLKGIDIPVFIKNPTSPDLELWIGAVERIASSGIKNIALIHRGFSSYGVKDYRNAPMWHLALEMKRRFQNLPFIIDPSHIAGKRDLLLEIAQHAIDLQYDGLMIESHIHPDCAWSDAQQQVTPTVLNELLEQIVWRFEKLDASDGVQEQLRNFRNEINHLDDEILKLLSVRMQIVDKIGQFKKDKDITILQLQRWNEILERLTQRALQLNLSEDFIRAYFEVIHLESIRHQDRVMNKK